ncbi:MAG: hypothetical protein GY711_25060 [bacterium]|nr:hypothetical protein [bacterium]
MRSCAGSGSVRFWHPFDYLDATFSQRLGGAVGTLPVGSLVFAVLWTLPFLWMG